MEDLIRKIPGVLETEVGYTGGPLVNPTYQHVKVGNTGHAEAIQVKFDPARVSYEELLKFFFRMHDPTTIDRQGGDVGSQYRSAIFFHSETQRQTAQRMKLIAGEKWGKPAVTQIVEAKPFYPAEDYHQDYLEKNPGGYTCHRLREW